MKSFQILALVGAAVANPVAQAVTSAIAPASSAPAGCVSTYSGTFEISIVNASATTTKRSTALEITLTDGKLTDAEGRTGYIASNYQFQFDKPPQAGAIYTSGWSVCANGTLALGAETEFKECLSGTFYNLYDESTTAAQCSQVYIDVVGGGSSSTIAVATTVAASESSDGQVTGSAVTTVTQISDGQIQASTSAAVVTQISDGQIQATTAVAATTSAAVVTQISDGQIQATTAVGTTSVGTTSAAVVSQISDGQIQATSTNGTLTTASATVTPFTGAAAIPTLRSELFGLAAGLLAIAAL